MKRKPSIIPLRISVRKTLTDFAENTTIHGIGYIFNALIPFIERCLWAVVFGFFAILAIYWSADIAVQWQADPVLTSVKSTGTDFSFLSKKSKFFKVPKSPLSSLTVGSNPFVFIFIFIQDCQYTRLNTQHLRFAAKVRLKMFWTMQSTNNLRNLF